MKRVATALVVVCWLTLLRTVSAYAQVPVTQPWSLTLGAGSFYDSTATGEERHGDVGGTLHATLARSLSFGPRGNLSLSGNISQDFYDLRHTSYGLSVSGSYAITRRLSWTIADTVNSSFGQHDKLLTDAGLVYPNAETLSHGLSSSLTYLLSRATDVHVAVASQSVGFDSSILTGGSNASGTFGLGRRVTPLQTLAVNYQYERTFTDVGAAVIQGVSATWHLTKQRASFSATGGAQAYTQPGQDRYSFTPASSLGWTLQLNSTHSLGLSYSNSAEQAFGFNRTAITQTVAGTYGLSYRRMTISFAGNYSRSTSQSSIDAVLIGEVGSASIQYRIRPNLGLAMDSSVYSTELTSTNSVSSYRTGISLSYDIHFR